MIKVTIWDEDLQETNPEMKEVYPQGIRGTLAETLSHNPELDHRSSPELRRNC